MEVCIDHRVIGRQNMSEDIIQRRQTRSLESHGLRTYQVRHNREQCSLGSPSTLRTDELDMVPICRAAISMTILAMGLNRLVA
jgi:hypothetical protein